MSAEPLTPYGAQRDTSPRLTEIAADSVLFREASAPSSWTLPSVVSLMTGLHAAQHGVQSGGTGLAEDGPPTLAEALSAAGYDTVGFSQTFIAGSRFGLERGFREFFENNHLNGSALRSQEVRRQFITWYRGAHQPGRPIFSYMHTVDPHGPYSPVGPFARFAEESPGALPEIAYRPVQFMMRGHGADPGELAHIRARYDGEVAYTDDQFGRFISMLRLLDLYDDSMIIVTSDHGEEFGEHGGFDHGRTLYEEVLHVPLIVKLPGSLHRGAAVDLPVSLVDLAATVSYTAGIAAGGSGTQIPGTPLPLVGGSPPERQSVVVAEVHPTRSAEQAEVHYRSFSRGSLKCIENLLGVDRFASPATRIEVYDLVVDPREQQPLDPTDPRFAECHGELVRWFREVATGAASEAPGAPIDSDVRELLRAVGYVE